MPRHLEAVPSNGETNEIIIMYLIIYNIIIIDIIIITNEIYKNYSGFSAA